MKSLHAILFLVAIAVLQLFFGGGDGTRLSYTLPSYALLGVSGLLTVFSLRSAPARMDRACLVSTILMAAYFYARIMTSPSAWLAGFDFYPLLAGVLIYFITALAVPGTAPRYAIVCGLIVFSLGHVGIGIYQFAQDANFHPLLAGGRGDAGFRASGAFISPNHLAGFLETTLLLATSLCFWGGFRARGKILMGYLALVSFAGLVLTGSRGGYLSAGVGLAVFAGLSVWTLRTRLPHGLLPRILAIVAAIALLGGGLMFAAERSFGIRSRASAVFVSSDIRLQLWDAAWKQFKLAPVFGTGSRTYTYYGRTFRGPSVRNDPVFAHNDWLQTLAEYGIAGILLVVIFIVAHLRHGLRRLKEIASRFSNVITEGPEKHALALHIGTVSAIAACLVHAMMDFNLHIPANSLLAAFLFGTLATRRARPEERQPQPLARALHAIPAALGLWMLVVSAPRISGELRAEIARGKFLEGKLQEGQKFAGEAIGRGVRNPELYFQLGEVQRILSYAFRPNDAERWALEDAHDAYAEALSIFPQDAGIMLRDAWVLGRLRRFEEAEPLLDRAKQLDPNSPKVWLTSALHWRERGEPAKALADFRRAEAVSYGWIPALLDDLHEEFDAPALEKFLQGQKAGSLESK